MASEKDRKLQEDLLKAEKERNRLLKERIALDKEKLRVDQEQLDQNNDFANVLQSQLKEIKFQKAEKQQLLDISRRITKEHFESLSIENKQLGTAKATETLKKKQAQLEADILKLKSLYGKIGEGDAKLQKEINDTINQRIQQAEDLNKVLAKQAENSKKISNNFSVRSFSSLSDLVTKIPGLSKTSEAFKDAADAAREAAAENLEMTGKTSGGLKSIFGKKGMSEEDQKILQDATAGGRGSKGFGKGLDKEFFERNKELANRLGITGKQGDFGVGAASKVVKGGGAKELMKGLTKPLNVFMKSIKALGPALKKAFGPLAILMEIMKIDKVIGDMAKGLNMNYREATQLKSEMTSIANESGNNFVTSQKLSQTLMEINKSLGTGVQLSDDMLVQFTEMREMAGFTNEELMGIAKISMSTGKEMNDITGEFMAQAKLSSVRNGVLLNEKELLKSVKDISAATTLSLGQNPVELAKAVATAKSLGMELSAVENIASGMLDFEQSIAQELQAELLTGKEINLEKARQAALDNDLATLAEEVAKNVGSAAEFGKMNRIQQDAIAKSVNMNREELAKTLFVQEQLRGATGEQAEEQAALLNKRIEEVGLAQAQKELAQDGVEGLRQQASMADRMTAAMDKLNEVFVSLIEPLMPVFDVFMGIFGIVGKIVQLLKPLFDFVSFAGAVTGDILGNIGNLITGDEIDFSSTMAAGNRLANDNYLGRGLQNLGVENVFASGNNNNSDELKRLNDNLEKGITANTYLDGNRVDNALATQTRRIP
jgi:hypothetical protein